MRVSSVGIVTAVALALSSVAAVAADVPVDSYLLRVEKALYLCRQDIPAMQPAAEAAAARLAGGGRFFTGGDPAMVNELTGRAGGFMFLKALGRNALEKGDVVIYTPEGDSGVPREVLDSGALIIALGKKVAGPQVFSFVNHAEEAGISPTLANAIPAWLFTGELVAALTRLDKMPVLYQSIGLYGGYSRIEEYLGRGVYWHEKHEVPPIAPGVLANRYVGAVAAMLRRVEAEERENINRAGAWAAEAKGAGKQLFMYSMGHIFPNEVENTAIGKLFKSGVWNSGFTYLKPPDDKYHPGDVLIHIGYQHPPTRMLERARPSGARVVYVDILRDRDYECDQGVIWVDPMWPWADACVPIEGYDVPALASSGVVNGAIAWEIYRVTERALAGPQAQASLGQQKPALQSWPFEHRREFGYLMPSGASPKLMCYNPRQGKLKAVQQ